MISKEFVARIEAEFGNNGYGQEKIAIGRSIGGGSINMALELLGKQGRYFLKYNSKDAYPEMFETERQGLNLLTEAGCLRIPEVLFCGEEAGYSFIVMEFVESGAKQNGFFEAFGEGLAKLHSQKGEAFGLDYDNYIGSLPQSNRQHASWADFFNEERLLPLVRMARDKSLLNATHSRHFDRLMRKSEELFPVEEPTLIHGDLWGGNYLADEQGKAVLIDPAVYYGHREMDLGMTFMFGGFSEAFYQAYHQQYPLEKGWQERIPIANLYPNLVHLNLFGSSYRYDIERVIKRFAL